MFVFKCVHFPVVLNAFSFLEKYVLKVNICSGYWILSLARWYMSLLSLLDEK